MRLHLAPTATKDIRDAVRWYAAQDDPALPDRFIAALDTTFSSILAHPLAFRALERGVRRARLAIFPYFVYYTATRESVTVLNVLHTRRHPDTWKRR